MPNFLYFFRLSFTKWKCYKSQRRGQMDKQAALETEHIEAQTILG